MSFETIAPAGAPTPGRVTTLTLDVDEVILSEPGMNARRTGSEIALGEAEGVGNQAVSLHYWSSGAWTLKFIQREITNIYETVAGQSSILPLSAFNTLQLETTGSGFGSLTSQNNFVQTDFTGAAYPSTIATTADPFMSMSLPATVNLDPSAVPGNSALVSNGASPTLPNTSVPMDRTGLSSATYGQDQAFFLRFSAPGSYHDYPAYIQTVGFGQYAVAFTGDGKALLFENCHDASGTLRWVQRTSWRYASSKQVMATSHTLSIFPHIGPHGEKFLAFGNNQLETSQILNSGFKANTKASGNHEFVYRADSAIRGGDVDEAGPGHVTTAAQFWWDERRGLKVKNQFSVFKWATSGTLTDFAHSIGTAVANPNPVTVTMAKVVPSGCTLTSQVKDARTQATFVPGTDSQPYPVFTFGGDGSNTPILYAYRMKQAEVTATISPGAFSPDIESASVTAFSGDPSEESAYCDGFDLTNTHTRLAKRSRFSALLQTTDPVAGTVALFRGYVTRPRSKQIGLEQQAGFNGQGAAAVYPASAWRSYQLSMQGMYMRLAERVSPNFGQFAIDPGASDGSPYKVTDVIRALLLQCGFASAQVDIPDLSYRLWPGHAGLLDDGSIQPGADVSDLILRMCRNYLGCYLWFNPNNGSAGKWQLLFGNEPSGGVFTPVYNFVTTPPTARKTVPSHPGAYPAGTAFIDGAPEYLTIPPSFNAVVVSADSPLTGTNTRLKSVGYAYNYLSFKVPGSSVDPNPEHPDYIGYCLPYEIVDPSLTGVSDAATWAAVAWTTRRAYDYYCHAQQIVKFVAPLVFVLDHGLGNYRPLRFQDAISIDGDPSYLIKSMTINFAKSHVMMCEYEVIAPMPGQYFMGIDGLSFKRYAQKRLAHKTTGHGTMSNHWGLLSVSPAEEQKRLALPLNNIYQVPLQSSDGSFFPIAGYNAATGGYG